MRHVPRILFGLLFLVPGILKLAVPWEIVAPNYGGGEIFMTAVKDSGYLFFVLAVGELVPGLMLLANRFVPFALALLGPIVLNIACFHIFLDPTPQGLAVTAIVVFLWVVMVRRNWSAFRPMLSQDAV